MSGGAGQARLREELAEEKASNKLMFALLCKEVRYDKRDIATMQLAIESLTPRARPAPTWASTAAQGRR